MSGRPSGSTWEDPLGRPGSAAIPRGVLIAAVFLALSGRADAGEAGYYLSGRCQATRLTGDARRSVAPFGDPFDFEETLGVDPTEPTLALDGFAVFHRYRLDFGYHRAEVGGSAILEKDLYIEGMDYLAGRRLASDIEARRGKLLFGYGFLDGDRLTLAPVAGLHLVRSEIRLKGAAGVPAQTETMRFLTPVAGGILGFHPGHGISVHAGAFGSGRRREHLFDTSVALEYGFSRRVAVTAGYAYHHFNQTTARGRDGRGDDDQLELIVEGWFVGFSLHPR